MLKKFFFWSFILLCFFFKIGYSQIVINEYSGSNIKKTIVTIDTIYVDFDDTTFYGFENSNDLLNKELLNSDSSSFGDTMYFEYVVKEDCNCRNFRDNFNKVEDWIELYNPTDTPVNINGYYLSDNQDNPLKFKIPACSAIPAKGYKLVFASGRGLIQNDTLHTNFRITQTKDKNEFLVLSDAGGKLLDKIKIVKTKACNSYARKTDGESNWGIFTFPTAGSTNNSETAYSKYSSKPNFDIQPGFYNSSIQVEISSKNPGNEKIFYTKDGTEPSISSNAYTGPIIIDKTCVLKAITVDNDTSVLPGFIEFNSYFINSSHTLPVISISGTSLDSLANGFKEIRPWGSIEYFDISGKRTANSYGEYNSHGQDSWVNDQRSIDFVARDEMGYSKELKEKLFTLSDRKKFQRIILRAAGDDNYPATADSVQNILNIGSAHLRDAYFQNLCKEGGMKLDTRTAAKCVVYINGKYWGVYDIREIPDDHDYTEYYYNQGKYDIQYLLTWGETWAEYGGDEAFEDWYNLTDFIFSNSMANQTNFDRVAAELDVESLADYVIGHSISVSSDWLLYNTGWWRGLNPEGTHKKWGYILWDNDASFAFYINYTGIPDTSASAAFCNVDHLTTESDPEEHIRILNKLRTNKEFNRYYISRYIDLINTTFSCENMLQKLDSLKNLIQPEMLMHNQRWPGGSFEEWEKNVEQLRNFIERRCGAWANNKLDSCYNLTGPYDVVFNVAPSDSASMQVNSLLINQFPWKAAFFGGIDIKLHAINLFPNEYKFYQWQSESNNTFNEGVKNTSNSIRINKNDKIEAQFIKGGTSDISDDEISDIFNVYPTQISDNVNIWFNLSSEAEVSLNLYNVNGRLITNLLSGNENAGNHAYCFNLNKYKLSQGVYIIRYVNKNEIKNVKIIYAP